MRAFTWVVVCLLLASCQSSPQREPAAVGGTNHPSLHKTERDYFDYIDAYKQPEFVDDNEQALLARVKLIDQIPPGGSAKVMTFVHDNGYATKLLAAHLCLAAKRGVSVQYLTDSKSGDRPGVDDMFDSDPNNKVNEELYQMLANCGVEVKVHNHIEKFEISQLTGKHIPDLPDSWKSWVVGKVWETGGRALAIMDLMRDFDQVTDDYVKNARLPQSDRKKVEAVFLTGMKRLARIYFAQGTPEALAEELGKMVDNATVTEQAIAEWRAEKTEAVESFIEGYIAAIKAHPRLGEFYRQSHVVNRLNHRKLFHVSYGNRACMFLGGRNLGDHYLTWDRHHNEFMDGDVFICDNHQAADETSRITKQAEASFNQLWNNEDTFDPLGVPPKLTTIQANQRFQYKYLLFPERGEGTWGDLMWIFLPASAGGFVPDYTVSKQTTHDGLIAEERTLVAPIEWKDSAAIHGAPLSDSSKWRVQMSTWNMGRDKVRAELELAINRERERIYIETAYSEFNSRIRRGLEKAMQRGIPVEVVTNSIFVADGGSKAIRMLMARWTRQMLEKYNTNGRQLFSIKYATIEHGHMIHFKGASFACQAGGGGRLFRLNLVGSHNFHGRSGYSDKEHALIWEQPPKQSCIGSNARGSGMQASAAKDLRDLRNEFYARRAAKASVPPLKAYATLADEFNDAIKSGKLSAERAKLAKTVLKLIYGATERADGTLAFKTDAQGRPLVRSQATVLAALELMADSGLSDIVGALL